MSTLKTRYQLSTGVPLANFANTCQYQTLPERSKWTFGPM